MGAKDLYVIPRGKGWVVREAGSAKDMKRFADQEKAIEYGKKIAKHQQNKLIVHGKDGKLQGVLTTRGW